MHQPGSQPPHHGALFALESVPAGRKGSRLPNQYSKIANTEISKAGWSDNEKTVIDLHHWWAEHELKNTKETVYPLNIVEMLSGLQ